MAMARPCPGYLVGFGLVPGLGKYSAEHNQHLGMAPAHQHVIRFRRRKPLQDKNPMGLMGNNPIAWMTHLNNVANQNVANIYEACITHPVLAMDWPRNRLSTVPFKGYRTSL